MSLVPWVDSIPYPRMVPLRLRFASPPPVADPAGAAKNAVLQAARGVLPRGARVAVAVGSRGIASLPELVRGTVAGLKELGLEPFIVPAMGSHGGATAEGQAAMLAGLGVTEAAVGAPVRSSMEVIPVAEARGVTLYTDRLAAGADGIVLVARVKPHTAFRGRVESGPLKMLTIGLGKQVGAHAVHSRGFGEMADILWQGSMALLKALPPVVAVAVVENAYDQCVHVEGIRGGELHAREPQLLQMARELMARIPFEEFEVLVVDRIGKNISGDGMDPNLTGRYPTPYASGGPTIQRIVVLDLTEETHGNANGLGPADMTTARVERKIDRQATYMNALTSNVILPVKLPMVLPSDKEAIAAALGTLVGVAPAEARVVRIRDTLHMEQIWVSENLLAAPATVPYEVAGPAREMRFDPEGNLLADES